MRFGSHVAIDLVATGMSHRFELGDLARILTFADRRVIPGYFFNAPLTKFVEPCVSYMSDRRPSVFDHGDREHARHAIPFRPARRQAIDLVVGNGNRLTHTLDDGAGLALETLANHRKSDVCRSAAGSLPTDSIDDDEQTARLVDVESILVDVAQEAGIGPSCCNERIDRAGVCCHSYRSVRLQPDSHRNR